MTKQEFLDNLRISLNGKIAASQVEEHIRYYEDYINVELRKGNSEECVMASLGDPRLIARTIVATSGMSQSAGDRDNANAYREVENECREYDRETEVRKLSGVPGWVWIILVLLIVIIVLGVIFSVISALMPVLLPIVLIVRLVKMLKNK